MNLPFCHSANLNGPVPTGAAFCGLVVGSPFSYRCRGRIGDSDALRSHLYQLRQALDKPFAQPMLLTVHGVGFRLDAAA